MIYGETGDPEDCDSDGEDHCGDESRYAVMSRPIAPIKKEKKPWDHLPLKEAVRWERIMSDFERSKEMDDDKAFLEIL